MRANKSVRDESILALCFLVLLSWQNVGAAAIKLQVTVDNAAIKATPEISGQTVANVPLDTMLDAESKQGEWYKISIMREGVQISGFIHELYVREVAEGEIQPGISPAGIVRSQAELAAEIEYRMNEDKNLIRQEKELDRAIDELRPLVARAFTIDDRPKQKQIACEAYLWLGLAYAKKGDNYGALKEFRNMFEVDYLFAKEITRNMYDPTVSGFIEHAEKQYRGVLVEYALEIATEPKEAKIKIDGKEVGISPHVHRTIMPKFTLEIEKEGYKTVREDVFLTQASDRKAYTLVSTGRTITISSEPKEASVFLDGEDTGKRTDCELPYVSYGGRTLRIAKKDYADWEETVQVLEGTGPILLAITLTPKNYVFSQKWGGKESKFFKLPKGIAFDKEGNFYVVDESDIKAKKFDPRGNFQSSWGDAGREPRFLKEPTGIAVDTQGNVYITDTRSACVAKFTKTGKFVAKWGKEGTQPGELITPSGIAVDSSGDIYVADSGNNRIVKYSPQGTVKKSWGKQGNGQGEFVFPTGLAVNQKNEVIVVDRFHGQKFTTDGQFIAAWGKAGSGNGELKGALGMCADSKNYIYVADTGNNRILKFDLNGKFITQWGTAGTEEGQMTSPVGVAVNDKGSVFVIERDNNRLQEFKVPSP
jgi:DNA-binding beta-propeller fold protein YncE